MGDSDSLLVSDTTCPYRNQTKKGSPKRGIVDMKTLDEKVSMMFYKLELMS